MSYKTAGKDTGKTSYVEAAAVGKKPGGLKTSPSGKSGKPYGLNGKLAAAPAKPKPAYASLNQMGGLFRPKVAASSKPKLTYASHTPAAAQIHDAGFGMQFADFPTHGLEMRPREDEAELAEELVEEIAHDGADVNALCETYQLKREELGRLTGFSLRALAEWAAGKLPSQPAWRRLQEVRRLLDALAQIVKRESIPRWLHQRNPAFDQLTPLQVIELGEIDRLWAMVHDMGSGQPE
jgi:DNA-binding transcriptional regulator YiaG